MTCIEMYTPVTELTYHVMMLPLASRQGPSAFLILVSEVMPGCGQRCDGLCSAGLGDGGRERGTTSPTSLRTRYTMSCTSVRKDALSGTDERQGVLC